MESTQKLDLNITGMTCDGCASHVRSALQGIEGVTRVEVPDWSQGKATVQSAEPVPVETLVQAVKNAGYGAGLNSPREISEPSGRTGFDLIVIGTGGAGMGAAIRAAELGRSVGIIEAGTIGGTCVNVGCVPSKTLLRAAEAHYKPSHHAFKGVHTRSEPVDWKTVIAEKDRLVEDLRQQKYVNVIQSYSDNLTLIRGRAKLRADGSVEVAGQGVFKAPKIVIATGARPRILPIEGIESVEVLTSTTAMDLPERPDSLIIIGGRFIALEQAQMFSRFGTRVTILQRSQRLIPDDEPEIAEAIAGYLTKEGVSVHTGVEHKAIREENGEKVVTAVVDGETREFRAEQVLMAAGRVANTDGLGLEKLGLETPSVELDPSGAIIVDDQMQSTNPNIFAAGDVSNRPQLVYVAAAAGGIAAENALNGGGKALDLNVLPEVVFTDPQIARVGLTEAQARDAKYEIKTTILPLEYVPRALAARDTRGLIKLVANAKNDRLLGAHILAAEGGEMIQTAALAIHAGRKYGFTVTDLRQMLFPYLVQAEGLKLAALTFDKDVSQLSCCAG
ncbi:MAG: mercury(II) reductase [bacterium]